MEKIDAEKILRECKRAGADSAEVFVSLGKNVSISSESGKLSEVREGESFGFGIRVIRKGKVGFSFGNSPEKAPLVARKAVLNSRIGGELPALPGKTRVPKVDGLYYPKIGEISGKDIIDRVKEIISASRGAGARPTYAGVSAGIGKTIVANTNGLLLEEKGTSVSAGSYSSSGSSTGFESKALREDSLDYSEIGRVSGERAVLGKGQEAFGTRKGILMLLHPYAVEGLLSGALIPSIDGENVFRKNSAFSGRLGEKMFSDDLTLEDNGLLEGGLGSSSFDSEGVSSKRTAVFEKGVLKNFLTNWETSLKMKTKSTGNASRGSSSIPKIAPTNLVLSPGRIGKDELEKEAEIKILWFSGTHTINPFSGDFSVEAKNVFSGKGRALKSGIVAGNIFEILKEIRVAKDGVERSGEMITPPVLIRADYVS